jgi:hypothetical protein
MSLPEMEPGVLNMSHSFRMNMTPGENNMTLPETGDHPGPGMIPGGMGSSVSFSMENVTDQWPLIRYLVDDPVYHERYDEILSHVAEESFNITELEEKIDTYHVLVESSVTGQNGEREGYTYLSGDADFDAAYDEMKSHIRSQYRKAMEYLSSDPEV